MPPLAQAQTVVTGAASGIGLAVAREFLARGARVLAVDRDADRLKARERELGRGKYEPFAGDVADPEALRRLEDELGERDLAVLVNCAGILGSTARLVDLELADWDAIMDVNLRGSFALTQLAARHMIARGTHGAIVSVASQLVYRAMTQRSAYLVAKAGLAQLTKAAALELAPHHIRVNAVAAGLTETRQNEQFRQDAQWTERQRERIPLGRFASPEEVADAVVYLSGEHSSYVTGSVLVVDGGYTI